MVINVSGEYTLTRLFTRARCAVINTVAKTSDNSRAPTGTDTTMVKTFVTANST